MWPRSHAARKRFSGKTPPLSRRREAATSTGAVYLGSGARYGAAREAALKMLEMTDGRVPTFAESFLGLRHGPMCALRETTLLVGFLASAEPHRSYERDLLQELADKDVRPRTRPRRDAAATSISTSTMETELSSTWWWASSSPSSDPFRSDFGPMLPRHRESSRAWFAGSRSIEATHDSRGGRDQCGSRLSRGVSLPRSRAGGSRLRIRARARERLRNLRLRARPARKPRLVLGKSRRRPLRAVLSRGDVSLGNRARARPRRQGHHDGNHGFHLLRTGSSARHLPRRHLGVHGRGRSRRRLRRRGSSPRRGILSPDPPPGRSPGAVPSRAPARAHDIARLRARSGGSVAGRSRRSAEGSGPLLPQSGRAPRHHRPGRPGGVATKLRLGCASWPSSAPPAQRHSTQARWCAFPRLRSMSWTPPARAIPSTPASCTPGSESILWKNVYVTVSPPEASRRADSEARKRSRPPRSSNVSWLIADR